MSSAKEGIAASCVYIRQQSMRLPMKRFCVESGTITDHYLVLSGILSFLLALHQYGIVLDVFTENEAAAFEWETEYAKDGHFSHQTADVPLWNEIAAEVKKKRLVLHIHGTESPASGIVAIERKRAYGTRR